MKALSCLLLLILFGCSDTTEPVQVAPTAGVWAAWADVTNWGEIEPYGTVRCKIDLDEDKLLWGDFWHVLEWHTVTYGDDRMQIIIDGWGRSCSGAGAMDGNELVVAMHCDDTILIDFRGTRE